MSSKAGLRVIPAYKGMKEYVRLARQNNASQWEQLWMQQVVEPFWSDWAAGQFNEARTREEIKQPTKELDALEVEVDLLVSSGVEAFVNEAYAEITRRLPSPLPQRAVCVYALAPRHGVSEGVVGTCIGDNIILRIDPTSLDWRSWARYVLAHEYHHAVWGYNYFAVRKNTSMDFLTSLLTDGQADSFARSLYPHLHPTWLNVLTPSEEIRQWQLMQDHLTGNDNDIYRRFMFGDESTGTPACTGYTIAYHIVQAYLDGHPDKSIPDLMNQEAWTILKETGYNPGLSVDVNAVR